MSKEFWTQYYKDVLLHILEDQRKEAVSFSFIMWGIAIICAGLLLFSYYKSKRKAQSKHQYKRKKKQSKVSDNRMTLKEKYIVYSSILALVFILGQALIVTGYQNISKNIHKDIETEAFAEYSGVYSVKYKQKWYQTDNRERTALISFSEDLLSASYNCLVYDIHNSNDFYSQYYPIKRYNIYNGKVVYAENSGYAVYWEK